MTAEPIDLLAGAACEATDGCLTCGDVAVPLTVVEVSGVDARCRDGAGREESVATELVGAVVPGDRLLVHARVAIGRLAPEPESAGAAGSAAEAGSDREEAG